MLLFQRKLFKTIKSIGRIHNINSKNSSLLHPLNLNSDHALVTSIFKNAKQKRAKIKHIIIIIIIINLLIRIFLPFTLETFYLM